MIVSAAKIYTVTLPMASKSAKNNVNSDDIKSIESAFWTLSRGQGHGFIKSGEQGLSNSLSFNEPPHYLYDFFMYLCEIFTPHLMEKNIMYRQF